MPTGFTAEPDGPSDLNLDADLVIPRGYVRKAADEAFGEIGTTGLRQYGGFVLEEWLQQLAGRRAAWVWREMLDNDPTVGAIMFAIRWLARGVEWRVEEGADPKVAEFVEEAMHDMSHTWGDFISEALSMLPYGWSLHELVYKRRQGPQTPKPFNSTQDNLSQNGTEEDDSNQASSQFKDGKIGWRKLPVRAQETLLNWSFDGYSGLAAMNQIDYHGGNHTIPIEKSLLFRTQTTRNNPEGRSVMRNAYTAYVALKRIKNFEAIGIERDLAGIPVLTPPADINLFSAGQAALYEKAKQMVTGVRRDEYEGIVLPSADWTFELVSSAGSRQIDTDAVIRRYRSDLAMSMLADFVLIGNDNVGSLAMVDVKSELFGMAIDGILDLICEVFNRYAIPRLLAMNGMDVTEPPRIEHGSAGRVDLEKVGAFLFSLAGAGAEIPWNETLVEYLLKQAGLPANLEEEAQDPVPVVPDPEEDAAGNKIEDEAPVGPPMLPPGQDPFAREPHYEPASAQPAPGQQPAGKQPPAKTAPKPVAKAAEHTGAMVALYPHPDVAHAIAQPGGEDENDLHLTLAFLGDAADIPNPEALHDTVARWAAKTPPLTGSVSGVGRFTAGPEPVTYASADVPELPEHRQRLINHLDLAGAPASRDHGFTPHITLAYGRNNVTPAVSPHALRFDRASLVLAGNRHDFYLTGKPRATVAKAQREPTRQGTVVAVAPKLRARQTVLAARLEGEINAALGQLGIQAATAYAGIATKASGSGMLHRLVGRVVNSLNLQSWINQHLRPILRNHAGRVAADTQRTLQSEINLQVRVADGDMQRIADKAGSDLTMRDIEPQVRASIMDAIKSGLANGENPVKTADRIRESVPAGRFVNAGAKYRSRLIARDQTAQMQRQASLASYQSNDNITAVRLRDGIFGSPRSDDACIARDGQTVPIDQASSIHPEHPACTLMMEPVVSGVLPDVPAEPEPALAA